MSSDNSLKRLFSKKLSTNSITEIRPKGDQEIFKQKLASAVLYMVKYSATINVKEGITGSATNVFQANLLRILDPQYIQQKFYPKAIPIGGSLKEAWFSSTHYADLKTNYGGNAFTLSNLFPVWRFTGVDNLHVWISELFTRRSEIDGSDSIFPRISDSNILLNLD